MTKEKQLIVESLKTYVASTVAKTKQLKALWVSARQR